MNGESEKQEELLCTTDCLEAVGAFKAMKNFLFVIIVICLLLLQISFWVVELDYIKTEQNEKTAVPVAKDTRGAEKAETHIAAAPVLELAAKVDTGAGTESEKEEIISAARQATRDIRGKLTEVEDEVKKLEKLPVEPASEHEASAGETESFRINFSYISWLIRFSDFILIVAAILYCLTLVFILKISLIGRLGGINHITRAFFLSLFMLVFMLPWQRFFDGVIVGAIFTPAELLEAYNNQAQRNNIILEALYYCRYMLLWLIVLLFAVFSQARTFRWSKATLRRLEII